MGTVRIALRNGLSRAQVGEMCDRLDAVLESSGVEAVVCEVGAAGEPDMTVVEALMRLLLTARRRGRRIRLDDPPPALIDLLSLTGLLDSLNRPLPRDDDGKALTEPGKRAGPEETARFSVPPPRLSTSAVEHPPP